MRTFQDSPAIAAVALALALAACSGGGGSDAPPPPPPEPPPPAMKTCADGTQVPADQQCPVPPPPPPPPPPEEPEPEPEPRADNLPFPLPAWNRSWYDAASNITWTAAAFGTQHYGISDAGTRSVADAQHMPIYHDKGIGGGLGLEAPERRFFVGVDQGETATDYFTVDGVLSSIVRSSGLSNLPTIGERGGIEVRHGRLSDGAGRAAVTTYLSHAGAGFGAIPRWQSAPEVRLVGTSTPAERQRVISAVQLVNAALPEGRKLTVGVSSQASDDGIDVEFVDCYGARHSCGGGTAASTEFGRSSNGRIEHSYIVFSRETVSYGRERETVILLAHELMHALGLSHVPPDRFATIMEGTGAIHHAEQSGQPQPLSLLYAADREALRALYAGLEAGGGPESLGPWSANSTHLAGNGPHANFGVALRNGYAEPWAHGFLPSGEIAANPALSGWVTWRGALLGFTPDAEAVSGDASIHVDVEALTGNAVFLNLENWAPGAAPSLEGTGTTWLDGDLRYDIAVRGNTFRETDGDAGRLTGIFTGAGHEGAAGTLERSDLTAAFGASRE